MGIILYFVKRETKRWVTNVMNFFWQKNKKVEKNITNFDQDCGVDYNYRDVFRTFINSYSLSVRQVTELYQLVSAFSFIVFRVSDAYANIKFTLKDKSTDEFITDHPVLDLLNKPNGIDSSFEFKKSLASNFLITGNAFLLLTGNINQPPLEVWNIPPINIQLQNQAIGETFGGLYPSGYLYNAFGANLASQNLGGINSLGTVLNFTVREDFDAIHYYNGDMRELLHLKEYNAALATQRFYGMSRAFPAFIELDQYLQGNVNNLSLLKRGARPPLALTNTTGEALTDEQYRRVRESIKGFSGAANAGYTPFLDGMDIKAIGQSNVDMQYIASREAMKIAIANCYGFPLALFSESVMTLNNLQTSRLLLDTDAVVPMINQINQKFDKYLLPRYADGDKYEFHVDLKEMESYKSQVLNNALIASQVGVNTVNELRREQGYEDIEGGDVLQRSVAPAFGNGNGDEEGESKDFQLFCEQFNGMGKTEKELKILWQMEL